MKLLKLFQAGAMLMVLLLSLVALVACEREGPMERAGEKADQAVEETKENMEQVKEKAEETVK